MPLSTAHRLKAEGKLEEAADAFRRHLDRTPDSVEALNDLGNVLMGLGRLDEACDAYRRALALKPDLAECRYNLAAALLRRQKPEEAAREFFLAGKQAPHLSQALDLAGQLFTRQGRLEEAVAAYSLAATHPPLAATTFETLGGLLRKLGRLDDAVQAFRRCLDILPGQVIVLNNLGNTLLGLRRLDEAVDCYRRAIAIDPNMAESHYNMGGGLMDLGLLEEAVASYRRALALRPDLAEAHNCIGNMLSRLGRQPEAIEAYRAVLRLKPDHPGALASLVHRRHILCDWDGIEQEEDRVLQALHQGKRGISPFTIVAQRSSAQDQLLCARQWQAQHGRPAPLPPRRASGGGGKIRIGYLSGDFRQHAVASLTAGLFESHDRGRFEIFAYSFGADDGSKMRARLLRAFDHFIDIRSMPDGVAARRIQADGIDILVDLAGYTKEARTAILAYRPAPVQVNYLGYPGTLGADFVDYILADSFVAPLERQADYVEKLVHLPGCFMVSDSKQIVPEHLPTRQEAGLPAEGTVFCSFNNSWKYTPQFFDIWMRVLTRVPGSVLWLREVNATINDNLRREAARRGVAPQRVVFAPTVPSAADHLARLRLADLFLDTLPYNAHTTANDALWVGLPVLTCPGETFASRVAGSLLRTVGLPQLMAGSLAEYEAMAVDLATHPTRLAEMRRALDDGRRSFPLFDTARFTRNVEAAYEKMAALSAAGQPAQAFAVTESPE